MSSRIAHLILEEDSEDVWMAGGPHGMITLHVVSGHPDVIVAHSPREMPGWEKTPTCMRLEGLPCWYLRGQSGGGLIQVLAGLGVEDMQGLWEGTNEQGLWKLLDLCYRVYLAGAR